MVKPGVRQASAGASASEGGVRSHAARVVRGAVPGREHHSVSRWTAWRPGWTIKGCEDAQRGEEAGWAPALPADV